METIEQKKVSANDTIELMLKCVNLDKMPDFYQTAERYAKGFVQGSSVRYRLLDLVRRRPLKMTLLDSISNDLKKLVMQQDLKDENVFLNDQTDSLINELIAEWENADSYNFHNIPVRNKVLLHGPTGNGKTTIARNIAAKSKLPYVEVKSDEIIDSHLGSTGSNIFKIFNLLTQPCVLFWDEVDSIGYKRGSKDNSAASNENDRMTNSILVNIEKMSPEVIFIGATNRREILDSAFIRRFDVIHEVAAPIEIEKERFAHQLISYYKLPIDAPNVKHFSSYSDIKREVVSIARKHIVDIIRTKITA